MRRFLLKIIFIQALVFGMLAIDPTRCVAQNGSKVTGRVLDSLDNQPIYRATIAAVNESDSSLISYTLSDKMGNFSLHNLQSTKRVRLIISHFSYAGKRLTLSLSNGGSLGLNDVYLNVKTLNEVVVRSSVDPVRVRKDTIEFAAEAFKVRPNAVVEDLLKKLPGMEVDSKGNIYLNGREVTKVRVDGKRFFGSNPLIATRNLDASIIDKVQVYDDREDDPDGLIPEGQVGKVINLTLKKAYKKSVLGRLYSGYGSNSRYEAGTLLNYFRDKLQLSVVGLANNLGRTSFSSNDLSEYGGFRRSGTSLYDGTLAFSGLPAQGVENLKSSGFNFNYDKGTKLSLNLLYFYSRTDNFNYTVSNRQQFAEDLNILTFSNSQTASRNDKHYISGRIESSPSTDTKIKFAPNIAVNNTSTNYTSMEDRSNNKEGRTSITDFTSARGNESFSYSHNFSYYHKLNKKGTSVNASNYIEYSPSSAATLTKNSLDYFDVSKPDGLTDRFYDIGLGNTYVGTDFSFLNPTTQKLSYTLGLDMSYRTRRQKQLIFNQESAIPDRANLLVLESSNLVRNEFNETFRPGLSYKMTKSLTLKGSVAFNFSQLRNNFNVSTVQNVTKSSLYVFPSLSLVGSKFSVTANTSISQPDIYDIQPVTITSNPLFSFKGNPDLRPSMTYNVSYSYSNYIAKSQVSLGINSNLNLQSDQIVRTLNITPEGAQSSSPINSGNALNASLGFNFTNKIKTDKSIKMSTGTSLRTSFSSSNLFLNQNSTKQENYFGTLTQKFSYEFKDKIEIRPSYSVNFSAARYHNEYFRDTEYWTHTLGSEFSFRLSKRLDVDGEYSFKYRSPLYAGFNQEVNLLNFSLSYLMFNKNNGEIKLSVYDVFNQNTNTYRNALLNSIIDRETNNLRRYFLMTHLFKFNKAIKNR